MNFRTCQHGPARRRMLRKMQRPLWVRILRGAIKWLATVAVCTALTALMMALLANALMEPIGHPRPAAADYRGLV